MSINNFVLSGYLNKCLIKTSGSGKDYASIEILSKNWKGESELFDAVAFGKVVDEFRDVNDRHFLVVQGNVSAKQNDRGYTNLSLLINSCEIMDAQPPAVDKSKTFDDEDIPF